MFNIAYQSGLVRSAIKDAMVINGIVFIKLHKKRRNSHFRKALNYSSTPYLIMKNPPQKEYYYYVGGYKLAKEFDILSDGMITDLIGEEGMKLLEDFWSEYTVDLPLNIAYIKYILKGNKTLSFLNRHYYLINFNLVHNRDSFDYSHNRLVIHFKGDFPKPFTPDPYYSKFIFMLKDFRTTIPYNTKWVYKEKTLNNQKVRVYPELGKSTDKFIITDSLETVDEFTRVYGDEFLKLYLYLETRRKK